MKISKDKYEKVIIALDSIRCDNREGKTTSNLRQMDDDVMEYIERKGYCRYILGEHNLFIRTLTDKGFEVLGSGTYEEYLKKAKQEKRRLKAPIIISRLALGISVFSLLFSGYQFRTNSRITIKHNKLSVKPILNVEKNTSQTYPKVSLTLKNKGIGPALIVRQDLFYNGVRIGNWSDLTSLIENDSLIFWKGYSPEWFDINTLSLTSLTPTEDLDVFKIDTQNLENMSNAIAALGKISAHYIYTNIYEDTFSLSFQMDLVKDFKK